MKEGKETRKSAKEKGWESEWREGMTNEWKRGEMRRR